ncbi:hypothetical protein BTJ40_17355 [Microbulbifer sp. A4B17]|uniref:DUF4396 domain-containing protein n=1 Tax=Microbulbifer sp. A4B17 TaxID=359370 RepID=UPI000D52C490|nr:DUF4396 domain-containing protein [Microbulbifer sp. A4B17]AWF82444.1 hypothetical protein BTJ40_17355 [Microbulbifer sp. A4B17]
MLTGAMLVWFFLTCLSVTFVIWDSITNAPTSWVQRLAWILVVVYTGAIGLFFYLLTCRRPFPGGHDKFTKAAWKQSVNSEMHCLAGDATGILIAASIVPTLGLTNGWDSIVEYLAGFICGLFVFQALMMRNMYQGNYLKAVRKTFFAETVSMNMVMAGMIPTMILLTSVWPDSEDPTNATFWFRMSLATIVGGIIAYPINYWLVKNHLKHGCMTLPGKDGAAPNLGHCSYERTDNSKYQSHMTEHNATEKMEMRSLPRIISSAWVVGTFIVLFIVVYITSQITPIYF